MNQQNLFPGNRGCGQRERGAVYVEIARGTPVTAPMSRERCVVIRIDGLKTKPKNRSRFTTKGGAMAEATATKKCRSRVKLELVRVLGGCDGPTHVRMAEGIPRVVLTRLSAGELDRGAVWEALKPVWDGVADAFGLASDREIQERGDVQQARCKRGTHGVVVELFFSV